MVRVGSLRFAVREPPRSSAATHSALRDGVVRVGSLCLNHPELVHHVLSSEIYLDSCCFLSSVPGHVLGEGSVQSNHPDLM